MAPRIREAAGATRYLIEWGRWDSGVSRLCGELAVARLYSGDPRVRQQHIASVMRELRQAVVQEYMLDATAAGKRSAEPILRGLKGRSRKIRDAADVRRALKLGGVARIWLTREIGTIRQVFAAELKAAGAGLSAQAEAVFLRARLDARSQGKGVRGLAKVLAQADKSALNAATRRRQNIRDAAQKLRDAEKAGKEAATKAARAKMRKARQNARRSGEYTYVERFETAVRAAARNAVRRTAQQSQMAYFRNAGYGPQSLYTYVAANGTDACPVCAERHGETKKEVEWHGEGPAEGTYCGDSCCCELVPADYAAGNQSLEKPLSLDRPEGPQVTPTHPDGPEPERERKPAAPKRKAKPKPRKVGGKDAKLAKEAKKRAASFRSAKTVNEAEARARAALTTGKRGSSVDLSRFGADNLDVLARYLATVDKHRAGIQFHRIRTKTGGMGELSAVSKLHLDKGVPARMQTKSLAIFGPVWDLKAKQFEKWVVDSGLAKQMTIRTVEDVAIHEMGHARVTHMLHLTRQRPPAFAAATKKLASRISPLARTNYREYLAEAYTATHNGVATVDAGTQKALSTIDAFLGSPERARLEAVADAYAQAPSAELAKKWDDLAERVRKKFALSLPVK